MCVHASCAADTPLPGPPQLVALVGVDGCGKTTQARRLTAWLTETGTPTLYALNAGGRRWLGQFSERLGQPTAQQLLGIGGLLVVESVLRGLAIARSLLRARFHHQVAVMDRYTVCQYASIRAHRVRCLRPGPHERLARWAYRIFPRPEMTFLLAVDPAEAYRRIEARGTDHESLEFLIAAAQAYRELPEAVDFMVIDANPGPDEVTRAIRAAFTGATGRRKSMVPRPAPKEC